MGRVAAAARCWKVLEAAARRNTQRACSDVYVKYTMTFMVAQKQTGRLGDWWIGGLVDWWTGGGPPSTDQPKS